MASSHLVLLAAILAVGAAEVVNFDQCSGVSNDFCSVTQVRITPCTNIKKCSLEQGTDVSLSFDFTPNFAASKLKTKVTYNNMPFAGISEDACEYTSCPSVAGASQTFNYQLHIGTKLPAGTYPIIWKVWDADNNEQVCCFSPTIKIKKSKKKRST